jgi:hypothetical protein
MTPLVLSTIITCSQAIQTLNRLTSVVGLTEVQKSQISAEIKKIIPSCPIIIKGNEPSKK